jgi:hypothetical protein
MAFITTCRTCSRTLTCREPVAAVMLPSVFHNYMNCILDPVASCYIRQHISAANHLSAPKYCFFITRKHRHQSTNQNLRICPLVIYLVEPLLGWRKDSPATYGAEPVSIQFHCLAVRFSAHQHRRSRMQGNTGCCAQHHKCED